MLTELKLRLASILGYLVLKALWASYRVEIDAATQSRLAQLPEPAIFAYWHDQIFVSSPFLVRHLIRPSKRSGAIGRSVSVMISPSADGELVARTIGRLGLTVVRGSASRDGAKALRGLYRHVVKERSSPVLLPDGPKGPAHIAKAGTVVLAQLTGAPIAPLGFRVSRAWTLKSWDRMKLPQPFARIQVTCGDVYNVPRQLTEGDAEEQCRLLAERINACRTDD